MSGGEATLDVTPAPFGVPRSFVLCGACCQPVPVGPGRCDACGARPAPVPRWPTRDEAMDAAREAVRVPARLAAEVIRAGLLNDPDAMGEGRRTFVDGRPRFWQRTEWANAPGFVRTVAGSLRARTKAPVVTYSHRLLPGWEYAEHELWELLQDLDALADGRGWPTSATVNPRPDAAPGIVATPRAISPASRGEQRADARGGATISGERA